MKTKLKLFHTRLFCAVALGIGSSFSLAAAAGGEVGSVERGASEDVERGSLERGALVRRSDALTLYAPRLPWSQLGAKAGADYQGDGLAVSSTADGARLRCVFQRLQGEVTREGLWLTSTVTNAVNDRFRIVAAAVGRDGDVKRESVERQSVERGSVERGALVRGSDALTLHASRSHALRSRALANSGTVAIDGQTVRFTRPGLVEEYSVSMDGVRQDFVIEQRPAAAGQLRVELTVMGAKVEPLADGAQLVLENSGRKIAYSRLRVTDATGKELSARMEVSDGRDAFHRVPIVPGDDRRRGGTHPYLVVVVNDAEAVYPVRIDPTFSDANWMSMGGIPGADGYVFAAVVDGAGNLYIGGSFGVVGDVIANNIARWDGSSWTALGLGMNSNVYALAVSGSEVYAGGTFTTAGGSAANYIAKWNGNSWSALGSGMNGQVRALAVSGGDLYAGGYFRAAGGIAAYYIAKWDGSSWSALGSGMGYDVLALAVSGSDLYAGGEFSTAGGSTAYNIAKWNGSSWSALGSGLDSSVDALVVSGSDVYAGGYFTAAGASAANYIAKWNGSVGQQRVCGGLFRDGGRQHGQRHRQMGREQLVGSGFGDGQRCVGPGGVGQRRVCGGRIHHGGRERGQSHCRMEREQLDGAGSGFGGELHCICAGGVGQRPVCGRLFHNGGRQRGQLHCQMGREQLVGAGFGDGRRRRFHAAGAGAGSVGQ